MPMSSPDITDAERTAVSKVLQTPFLSMGNEIRDFEENVRQYTNSNHAIGVSSGTAGLHLCVLAAGIKPGDLVITTPFSFVASANVLLFENAVPIFVDVDPKTGNIDPDLVRKAIEDLRNGTDKDADRWLPGKLPQESRMFSSEFNNPADKLKAILPVDVFGQPADMDPILEVAREHSLYVIEDSCEALGAQYRGKKAGSLGDFGVFAFYPNKQITTGEGAMIVTDDDHAALTMRSLRNQGRSPGDTWLQHTLLGYNYRLDEMSAAIGKVQVTRLDELLAKREQVADWYQERLGSVQGIETLYISPDTTRMSWFVYVVRFSEHLDRDLIADKLGERGVPARPYFIPIHLQPYMVERFGYQPGDFPITEELGRRGLAIPFSGVMTEEQVAYVCEMLEEVVGEVSV